MISSPLIIASHNAGKIREFSNMLAPLRITVRSAAEAGMEEPEETGSTFAENALLKARHAMQAAGQAALADDSGLSVAALDGAPGVYSARWAGPNKDFAAAFARIERELGNRAPDAAFICVLALCLPDGSEKLFEGRIDGRLVFPPRGEHGFGYDPIFIPHGYNVTFAQMDAGKKNRISHRGQALAKFTAFLQGDK